MADNRGAVRVVVADDSASLRDLLSLLLSVEDDFSVVGEAANGAEAVELARRHQPDLVLLDLAMPVMDGLEAIEAIREAVPDTKVVIFSGFESAALGADALRRGADGYVEKGVGVMELVSRLREICRPQV